MWVILLRYIKKTEGWWEIKKPVVIDPGLGYDPEVPNKIFKITHDQFINFWDVQELKWRIIKLF